MKRQYDFHIHSDVIASKAATSMQHVTSPITVKLKRLNICDLTSCFHIIICSISKMNQCITPTLGNSILQMFFAFVLFISSATTENAYTSIFKPWWGYNLNHRSYFLCCLQQLHLMSSYSAQPVFLFKNVMWFTWPLKATTNGRRNEYLKLKTSPS